MVFNVVSVETSHYLFSNSVFVENDTLIHLDAFTSAFTKKFMIWLDSRVRHYLTHTLRSLVDKRGFFYLNYNFFKNFSPFYWTSICYCMEASIHRNLPFLLKSILTCVLFFDCYDTKNSHSLNTYIQ